MLEKTILDNLNAAVLLFDPQLTLIYINSAGEILLADSAKHLMGNTAQAIFSWRNPDLVNKIQYCLNTHESLTDRELPLNQAEQRHMVNFSLTPIIEHEQLSHILFEMQVVDRHLQITREVQLQAQQNTSKMLVRGLAHEIKNPLGGIRGAAQLLELELSDPELKEYTQIIISESDRLQLLIDKMLGPNKPAQKSLINVHQALEHVKHLVSAETGADIRFITDYDPSIPEIMADINQLIQVFLNIVRNAIQILADGGEIIFKSRIRRRVTIGQKRYKLCVKIDIIDNGPGIDPSIAEHIFYPMITSKPDGAGLGLSIAHSLIHQHHGFIECDSAPGKTRFSIFLPIDNDHTTF
jgi:two-component system nitrogen regulation sensor histidine kinase GlnL